MYVQPVVEDPVVDESVDKVADEERERASITTVKSIPKPREPSEIEEDKHATTHIPFQSW